MCRSNGCNIRAGPRQDDFADTTDERSDLAGITTSGASPTPIRTRRRMLRWVHIRKGVTTIRIAGPISPGSVVSRERIAPSRGSSPGPADR